MTSERPVESAIPEHLRAERSRPTRTPEGYRPPSPSFVARPPVGQRRVVMAYLGAQVGDGLLPDAAFAGPDAPRHSDRAVDGPVGPGDDAGGDVVTVGYWDDVDAFDRWFARHREPWLDGDGGRWVEVLRPTVERYETIFGGRRRPEGVARLADGFSGEVLEHGYWGSMRDRMPAAQTDDLHDPAGLDTVLDGERVRVHPRGSLCLIRSGQDWTDTVDAERERYLGEIEPTLRAGMDFLRDEGRPVGCLDNRYLTVLDDAGAATERTFGMGWWRSLADLERWSESHPTHLAIFDAFLRMVAEQGRTRLRLHHEVSVARPDETWFEYARCRPGTGLLGAS